MKIASRMSVVDSSGIRKVFDLAKNMKNPINLSIGQPDFDIPDPLKETAYEAIRAGHNRYTLTQGIPELREKVRQRLKEKKSFTAEEVMITSGVSGGIFLSFMALLDPGDEIIVPDPYFVMYKHLSRLLGAVPKYLDLDDQFQIDTDRLKSMITPKTKAILLNSPSNPTGVITKREVLREIAKIAGEHGLLIISDEIYDGFYYDTEYVSIGEFYPNTIILGGFSKEYAMTGWRVGYAAGPAEVLREMIKLQQYTFVCAPSFAQYAAVDALDFDTSIYRKNYTKKRDIIYNGLKDSFDVVKPDGAFYIFPKAPGGSGTAFSTKAIEKNVLIIPGNVFSEKDTHIRIAFTATDEELQKGVEILTELAQQY
ncbi:MAG: pyridoxal phosphate-dependent aminotransferase [Candidatus Auribacterota bacterium]